MTYAVNGKADFRADGERFSPEGAHFTIRGLKYKETDVLLPMSGYHNIENATGVFAAARALGLSRETIAKAFRTFTGVKRRQEPRGEIGGVLVLDDFAHHPTAVRETIEGVRQRYPERRLWAVFEPRSNTSRRNIHQADYVTALANADVVTIREPEPHDKVPLNQQLDVGAIVQELNTKGVVADAAPAVDTLVERVSMNAQPNDLLLVMSNGSFGGFIPSVLERLKARSSA